MLGRMASTDDVDVMDTRSSRPNGIASRSTPGWPFQFNFFNPMALQECSQGSPSCKIPWSPDDSCVGGVLRMLAGSTVVSFNRRAAAGGTANTAFWLLIEHVLAVELSQHVGLKAQRCSQAYQRKLFVSWM